MSDPHNPAADSGMAVSDHDSPWKSAIEVFFQPCLELLFPQVAARLDWSHEPAFMDTELQKLTSDSSDTRRHVDKLIRVRTLGGEFHWILLHIEVQGEPEAQFTRRMFTYYYRLIERFDEPVVSMAILTDTGKHFRPDHYRYELMGCAIRFDFLCVKLLDLQDQLDDMLASDNIFALLVAAQLIAKQVKQPRQRTDAVLNFYRMARKKGYSRQHIYQMHDFIEWMIRIPKHELSYYNQGIHLIEQEDDTMGYMAIYKRESFAQGREQGIEQGIEQGMDKGRLIALQSTLQKQLQLKFRELDAATQERLQNASAAELELWTERILFADSLEAVFEE